MYCVMWASVPSLYNVYRHYDTCMGGGILLSTFMVHGPQLQMLWQNKSVACVSLIGLEGLLIN